MAIQESLRQIRPAWVERVAHELASGEGVRVGFMEQLDRFYDLLEQTVVTGNTAWLDPILYDWGRSPTETNLEEGGYYVSFVMNRIVALTIEVAREALDKEDALELIAAVTPIFTHSLSVVVRYEMETRVTHISNELGKAQEKLEELDHKKSNFISVTAHELKTPLTLIEGYATMMADMMQESGQMQMDGLLKGMGVGIGRMRRIIEDMLDVSLIDNNLLKLNIQPLWISHLVSLLQNDLKNIVAQRKQHLIVNEFEGRDLMIYGDSERLYQSLYSVATNAVKYTPDGGIVTIDGRMLPGFIEITVTDTGIGISPKHQTQIFEKFGQLGRTDLHSSGKTKFKGGGPGLGLSIAKGIIEAHGGALWVESEGCDEVKLPGSTFHILLPTRAEPNDPRVTKLFGEIEQSKLEDQRSNV
ncbi:MAG: HAMP domain-containing sensor histidine kinase [Anaerolineales bacterium]|nr:HAMP domain-containing sensor histidine kinase [Anaerolineales bacterium]